MKIRHPFTHYYKILILILFNILIHYSPTLANSTNDKLVSNINLQTGESHDICMLTWNTKLKPPILGGANIFDICESLQNMADSYDIILLQEVWQPDFTVALTACLTGSGFTDFKSNFRAGLLTASKFPIVDSYFEEYNAENGHLDCGGDEFADKGFLYTKIELESNCFAHVINTHLDAGSCQEDIEAKMSQLQQLSDYLDGLEQEACGEPIMIGGDMNVSYYFDREDICIWIYYPPDGGNNIVYENYEDIPHHHLFQVVEACYGDNDLYKHMLEKLNVTASFDLAEVPEPPGTNSSESKVLDYFLFVNSSISNLSNITYNTINDDDGFNNPSDHQPVETCYTYECQDSTAQNCLYNPYFTHTMCEVNGSLEITITPNTPGPHHGIYVYLKEEGAECESNNLDNATLIYEQPNTSNDFTIILPYEEYVGKCLVIKHGTWSECCDWWEFRRAITIPDLACDFNPYFTREICEVDGALQITVNAVTPSPNHGIFVYLKDEGAPCNSDREQSVKIFEMHSFQQTTTFTIPNYSYEELAGRCIIVLHGTWSECCEWREFSRGFRVEENTCDFNPYFTHEFSRSNNNLTLTVIPESPSPNHQVTVYLKNNDAECESNNLDNATQIAQINTNQSPINLTLPYSELLDQCIVIKHGTWSECCDWWEFRRAVVVPELPNEKEGEKPDDEHNMENRRQFEDTNKAIKVYPNPAKDDFTVSNKGSADILIELFDINEKLVFSKILPASSQLILDTDQLNNGIYFLKGTNLSTSELIGAKKISVFK